MFLRSLFRRRLYGYVPFFLLFVVVGLYIYQIYTAVVLRPLVDYEALVVAGLGENGQNATLHKTVGYLEDYFRQQNKYFYNGWLSERISLKRSLPIEPHEGCMNLAEYKTLLLPNVSIVIGSQQEHPQTVLRTLHSILNRTRASLLVEIILVSDGDYNADLEAYIEAKFGDMVRQLQHKRQRGIVAARLTGAAEAKGEVLVFLDAHVEVTEGWLEPLLAPIAVERRTCTEPMIDRIYPETFGYERQTFPNRLGFDWRLTDIPLQLKDSQILELPRPYEVPLLTGPAFAIDRKWFWQLGGYDRGLTSVDGDRLEMSIKLWMCGGRVLQVPCSRVGHVEKRDNGKAHAPVGKTRSEAVQRNFKRIVEVWFDDLQIYVFRHVDVLHLTEVGNIEEQKQFRKRLNCRQFGWFRKTVLKDWSKHLSLVIPDFAFGSIVPFESSNLCLDAGNQSMVPSVLKPCNLKASQIWRLTDRCHLRSDNLCLSLIDGKVTTTYCHLFFDINHWHYNYQRRAFVKNSTHCLAFKNNGGLAVELCDAEERRQRWHYTGIHDSSLDEAMMRCLILEPHNQTKS